MQPISIVIPAYNEAGNISSLVTEIFDTLPQELVGEVIVVDDASRDATGDEIAAMLPARPKLRLVRHTQNAGQSRAVRSGVAAARFPVVATLDGDGQNPPADIATLVAAWAAEGPQLVGGHRVRRRDTWSKRFASRFANGLRRALLRDDCPDTGCGLKVFPRDAHLDLPFFHGQHRYLPALMRAAGYSAAFLPVGDRPRTQGSSKYTNFQRAVVGIPDLLGVAWLVRRSRPTRTVEEQR
ncbi:glycosyltransferase family 2 protein [Paracoccus sp. (in: a-proteobacteria)]|uniref:glycosyltransferase family 2 protein n=1 Tax=Paracoccus sp. TaxID=267 RepID=UPI003A8C6D08